MIRSLAVTILVSCALLSRGAAQEITLDSARHTVVMRAGPFMAEPAEHSEHYGHAGMMDSDDPVRRFTWPCNAWLRGFALRLDDAEGSALPFQVDVRFAVARNTFPVPPGRHEWAADFELPVGGHLLIAGGHLHNYGVSVRLEDAATGRRILTIEARRDSSGRLLGMPRKLLALRGEGLRLKAGRRYRIVAVYDNPTADTIPGAMGIIGGLFAPDDPRRWPAIDVSNAAYRRGLGPPCRGSPTTPQRPAASQAPRA